MSADRREDHPAGIDPSRERSLIHAAAQLNQALERKRILETMRDLALAALGAEACNILLPDPARKRWEFHLAFNQIVDPNQWPSLSRKEGVTGEVAATRRGVLISDAASDPRLPEVPSDRNPIAVRSMLAVPICRADRVIGVCQVLNATRPRGFTQEDLEWLEALCHQAAVALSNARLYDMMRREKRAIELLNRVGLELAQTLRLHELLPLMAELMGELIEFNAVGIYLYHRSTGTLEWFYGRGYPQGSEEQVRLKVGQGAVGWTAQHKKPVIIGDVTSDARYLNARPETRSEIIVPLIAEGELVGVFNLESDHADAFDKDDLRLLTTFGYQAAIAIERAWLHDQTIEKRRLEEEIRIARRIQRRLLPADDPHIPGLDVAAFNHPSLEVSGDVYDFVEITADQLGIMIGDVAGKGIAAGIVMATFRASLRAEIRNNYAISVILEKVNRLMWESIEETAFVTAVYGVLDRRRLRLTYCNAGHDPPLLIRRSGEVTWLAEGGTVLGSFPNAVYHEAILDLRQGDLLVLYTDGVTEATSPSGEMFGTERLAQVARAARGNPSRGICRQLLEAVHEHSGRVHMDDDLTAVVLQVTGAVTQDSNSTGGYR